MKVAEQLYLFSDVCRILRIAPQRARQLQTAGELPGPDVVVPGGGRKAERWSASKVAFIQAKWSPHNI